jgi:hypothetical protein
MGKKENLKREAKVFDRNLEGFLDTFDESLKNDKLSKSMRRLVRGLIKEDKRLRKKYGVK